MQAVFPGKLDERHPDKAAYCSVSRKFTAGQSDFTTILQYLGNGFDAGTVSYETEHNSLTNTTLAGKEE